MIQEHMMNLATKPFGWLLLAVFIIGYYFIATEERYRLNKAEPALFIGTFMFMILGGYYLGVGANLQLFHSELDRLILDIAEIFFFLFVAMTYIEALIERGAFDALKFRLLKGGYSYKQLFWITGALAFFISPIADNLTTALILSTVLFTLDKTNKAFLVPSAISIIVAANAGGAWSPFGDITTLMSWSAGKGDFTSFIFLFPATFLGWLVTAFLLSRFVPKNKPKNVGNTQAIKMQKGGFVIISLGILTILLAITGKQFLHIPPMWGMLFGLSLLQLYAIRLKKIHNSDIALYQSISKIELDTLLFFFGILAAVGALHVAGFLDYAVKLYTMFDPTKINIGVGILSAFIDNVPVMSAVLQSNPHLDVQQWMLVTMTTGIGGSLISFGSAAGVGVMGKLKGIYTFSSHIKLAWTVLIGYIVSIIIWYLQFKLLGLY